MNYFVYILANKRNGTLYIGITNNLIKRVYEHKNNLADGFTKKYKVHKLVYYEQSDDVNAAIAREKAMKKWYRQWKIDLIEETNPQWRDLYEELINGSPPACRQACAGMTEGLSPFQYQYPKKNLL